MNLIVRPDLSNPARGHLSLGGTVYPCALGRSGVKADKTEGDGATPLGVFPLRRLLYRADRLARPQTGLEMSAIARHDGWCDAPTDSNYNRMVKLPYPASAEDLWREDHVYDLIVVLGHNDAPVVAHNGSAIFMHVATSTYEPTAGCVALAKDDLLAVLHAADPTSTITILPA